MSTADLSKPQPGTEQILEKWRHFFPSDEEIDELLRPKVELVETDGRPMDSDWHRMCMELLLNVISFHFRNRDDYYAWRLLNRVLLRGTGAEQGLLRTGLLLHQRRLPAADASVLVHLAGGRPRA